MIRKMEVHDIVEVMKIWLDGNMQVHDFIDAAYWIGNFDIVKEALVHSEVYVYQSDDSMRVDGFIGLNEHYIEGVFVRQERQSQGIGKALLEYVKSLKKELSLNVYCKNQKAIQFYKKEGFKIISEDLDDKNNEKEYLMEYRGE